MPALSLGWRIGLKPVESSYLGLRDPMTQLQKSRCSVACLIGFGLILSLGMAHKRPVKADPGSVLADARSFGLPLPPRNAKLVLFQASWLMSSHYSSDCQFWWDVQFLGPVREEVPYPYHLGFLLP